MHSSPNLPQALWHCGAATHFYNVLHTVSSKWMHINAKKNFRLLCKVHYCGWGEGHMQTNTEKPQMQSISHCNHMWKNCKFKFLMLCLTGGGGHSEPSPPTPLKGNPVHAFDHIYQMYAKRNEVEWPRQDHTGNDILTSCWRCAHTHMHRHTHNLGVFHGHCRTIASPYNYQITLFCTSRLHLIGWLVTTLLIVLQSFHRPGLRSACKFLTWSPHPTLCSPRLHFLLLGIHSVTNWPMLILSHDVARRGTFFFS